jgi:DNA topoisomerase VI subunit B
MQVLLQASVDMQWVTQEYQSTSLRSDDPGKTPPHPTSLRSSPLYHQLTSKKGMSMKHMRESQLSLIGQIGAKASMYKYVQKNKKFPPPSNSQ